MRDYKWLHEYCLNRFGSAAALEAELPVPRTPAQLRKISDDRYLSTLALRVFRAGLKHSWWTPSGRYLKRCFSASTRRKWC